MHSIALFHLVTLASLLLVAVRGPLLLMRSARGMTRLEHLAVALTTIAAIYWLVACGVMTNLIACRADRAICLAGNVYQLARNGTFLIIFRCLELRAKAPAQQ